MRPQEAIRQRLVLPQQPEQQMLGLDVRRPELTGLIAREENHAPRLLRIVFEHVPPSASSPAPSSGRDVPPVTAPTILKAAFARKSILSGVDSVSGPPGRRKPSSFLV